MIYFEIHLGCDSGLECCSRFTTSGLHSSVTSAKATTWYGAQKAGWKKLARNQHLCPACAKHAGIQNLQPVNRETWSRESVK